ncbi:MAG: adaptor protein MecA [Ruminococcaceae bacterium]|nr:adaptor protein MecA [Oscillospiraceae bacterium]
MELIIIGDSKLKIMLSDKDMEKYSLNIDSVDYDKTETRRAFWSILDDVKHRTGFDAANSKISVQLFKGKGGGCEMFVTKLNTDKSASAFLEIRENAHSAVNIYVFCSINSLLKVLSVLKHKNYIGRSSVYHKDNDYYLILDTVNGTEFINEYAERRENKSYIYHILEYCDVLCINNAVERLSPLY